MSAYVLASWFRVDRWIRLRRGEVGSHAVKIAKLLKMEGQSGCHACPFDSFVCVYTRVFVHLPYILKTKCTRCSSFMFILTGLDLQEVVELAHFIKYFLLCLICLVFGAIVIII
ncbi:hypothetical protein EGR_01974 [Echinococcus granulosus]|uniref:Uncharacterized protein n=1 Tax=Echinococcus granulosus TaxID=6210 RepID=W6UNH4_ECHGR|nr:hypothetical protein EGR_01974 [Echinococcus granulosus]EUB63170.1 hypothetical protein EGR_01974 [Echinococcus granulosus]